ncbi:PhzF family phenazine biosynthesis protein, partial [Aeromonas caviae]
MSRLYHVNAFSHHPFGGNPAVVVLGEARPDAELQAMAAEFNLSESAFLTQLGEEHYGLRWALLIKSVAGWPFPNPLIPLNSLAGE